MLNLRTHLQERGVVTFGNRGKGTPGMGSGQMPSTGMTSRPAGVTTVMTLTLTILTIGPPRSMVNGTVERLGAPMIESGEESDGEYEESSTYLEMQRETHILPQDP
jgi:hypothetical protein